MVTGTPEALGHRPQVVEVRVAVGDAVPVPRQEERAAAPVRHGPLELLGGQLRVGEREVGDGDEAPAGVAAEVGDPAVVGAGEGVGELDVLGGDLPDDPERRVQDGRLEALLVEQRQAVTGVAGAERHARHVAPVGTGPGVGLAHGAEQRDPARGQALERPAVDLDVLQPGVVQPHPEAARLPALLEVGVPQIGGFEDVPVAVDDALRRDARHRVPPLRPAVPTHPGRPLRPSARDGRRYRRDP